jgi:acyl-CoA thioesterase
MVDTAMGKATMSMLGEGQHCASVDIQMRFIRAVGDGRVVADAKVLRRGRTVVHLQAGVTDDEDHLIATAEGTFTIIVP